jgi:hypothetical protein
MKRFTFRWTTTEQYEATVTAPDERAAWRKIKKQQADLETPANSYSVDDREEPTLTNTTENAE